MSVCSSITLPEDIEPLLTQLLLALSTTNLLIIRLICTIIYL